ncbi:MAG: hypothetical protein ACRDUW_23800, partial [Pseudonocardiaceae bacterium]
ETQATKASKSSSGPVAPGSVAVSVMVTTIVPPGRHPRRSGADQGEAGDSSVGRADRAPAR